MYGTDKEIFKNSAIISAEDFGVICEVIIFSFTRISGGFGFWEGKDYISPVFGEVEMPHIIDAMKKHNLNNDVRFQVQIHKYVWDPNKTGV